VAGIVTVAFLIAWMIFAIGMATRIPDGWGKDVFLAVAGIGWGVPLFPLFTWAEHGRFFKPKS
jgi:hypothetical protein